MRRVAGTLTYLALMVPGAAVCSWFAIDYYGSDTRELDRIQVGTALVAIPIGLYLVHRYVGNLKLRQLRDHPLESLQEPLTFAVAFAAAPFAVMTAAALAVLLLAILGDAIV